MGGYGKGEHSECALSSCWHAASLTRPKESRKNSWSMRIVFPLTTLPPLVLQGPGQAGKIQEALKSLAFLLLTLRGFGSGLSVQRGQTCKTARRTRKLKVSTCCFGLYLGFSVALISDICHQYILMETKTLSFCSRPVLSPISWGLCLFF